MTVILRTLDGNAGIPMLTDAVRFNEQFGLRLVSLAAGQLGGQRANLATFRQGETVPPARPAVLELVDGALNQDQQQAQLNTPGRTCLCYGTLYVEGAPRNVAAYR